MAAEQPDAKRARVDEKITFELLQQRVRDTSVHATIPEAGLGDFICTHHGSFHADEAMACAMLKCLPAYVNMPILRSRNQVDIEQAAIVVDVGGTYEPTTHRYDHHQRTFTTTYSEAYPEIKLSSAGLVFKHFGAEVIEALCGKLSSKDSDKIVAKAYNGLIRELDALDNGVSVADAPRYGFVTNLGSRVGRLNPGWQDENSPAIENEKFKDAVVLAARELCDIVSGYSTGWLPARTIVDEALATRHKVHASGEVAKLPRFCPWQDHLFDLEEEEEANRQPLVKYVLFKDSRSGWRIQAAPKVKGSFANRLPLPKAWCGLRDQALSDESGVPGCVFIHANGFIGGHTTEAGALELASKALALAAAAPAEAPSGA